MKILWLTITAMPIEVLPRSLKYTFKDANIDTYFFDEGIEHCLLKPEQVDKNILSKVKNKKFDAIIYTGNVEGPTLPKVETLLELKNHGKSINLASDGGCPTYSAKLKEYKEGKVFDLIFNVDGNNSLVDMTFWPLMDPTYYSVKEKKIRLGFAGGTGGKWRRDYVDAIRKKCELTIPPRDERWGTYQAYADFMCETKMIVNFPETGSGNAYHMKSRVLEAGLGRCCLFEKANPITKKYFKPGFEYIEWATVDELTDKINHITEERIEFYAFNLHRRVMKCYTPDKVWREVFAALNLIESIDATRYERP